MHDKQQPDDAPVTMLSRNGIPGPLGKLDEALRTHVDESTAAAFRRRADALEQTTSELLRDLIYIFVHGETMIEIVAKHRRSLLDQQAQELSKIRAASAAG